MIGPDDRLPDHPEIVSAMRTGFARPVCDGIEDDLDDRNAGEFDDVYAPDDADDENDDF